MFNDAVKNMYINKWIKQSDEGNKSKWREKSIFFFFLDSFNGLSSHFCFLYLNSFLSFMSVHCLFISLKKNYRYILFYCHFYFICSVFHVPPVYLYNHIPVQCLRCFYFLLLFSFFFFFSFVFVLYFSLCIIM